MKWIPTFVSLVLLFASIHGEANEYRTDGRIVAIGVINNSYEQLHQLLLELSLIDESGDWSGADAYLVSLGDLVGQGPDSRKVLDLLMRLQSQAPDSGGRVLQVLGDHELMLLAGDLQYVSESDHQFAEAFSPFGVYGAWLLSAVPVIKINDSIFVHGGLSSELFDKSVDEINQTIRTQLEQVTKSRSPAGKELKKLTESENSPAFSARGPIWYRGNSTCHPYSESFNTEKILKRLGAMHIIVGHAEPVENMISRINGQVILAGSGAKESAAKVKASALVINKNGLKMHYLGASQLEDIPQQQSLHGIGSDIMTDEEIEEFLLTATITRVKPIGLGVTKSSKITLKKNGVQLNALFKTYDSTPGLESRKGYGRHPEFEPDRYQHELAAYRIDRLLDLHLVPASVERTIDGQKGLVQLWLENVTNETERVEKKLPFDSACARFEQYRLRFIFDVLIYNTDRNTGNFVFTNDGNMMYLIDHSLAFGLEKKRPAQYKKVTLRVSGLMEGKLLSLTPEILHQALSNYLHPRQIDAIIDRRDLILKQATRP